MSGEKTIKIKFLGDTSDLENASAKGTQAINGWSNSVKGFATALAGLEIGRKLIDFGRESIDAFKEAQESQDRLEDAYSRFPKLANANIDSLRALDTELEKKTKFDDDALAAGQAVLAQFKLTGQQIEALTPLLADYAAKTGQDVPEAATTLGKAFLGNTRALKELGINYKSTGNYAKDVSNITQQLRNQVGGFAEKEGKTAAGQAEILSNQFGELKETIGGKLLPVIQTIEPFLFTLVNVLGDNLDIIGPLATAIGAVTAAQWLWNAAMAANPIGLAIIAVAAIGTGIALLVRGLGGASKVWGEIWGGMKGAAREVFRAIAIAWDSTVGQIDFTVPSWVPGIGGKHFSAPQIPLPTFHTGGIVPGTGDQLIRAQGGEMVLTRQQQSVLGRPTVIENHIHVGDEVVRVVRYVVNERDRGTRRWVTANSGAAA